MFYPAYEQREAALVRRFLRPGDVVLDIRAHVGFFTLRCAQAVGTRGEVHSFEPIPANFAAL